MTPPNGNSRSPNGFRWTCPICGRSQLNRLNGADRDEGLAYAIGALRAHLVATDDREHGPRNEYPADFDPDAIDDHVVRVAGEEAPVESDE